MSESKRVFLTGASAGFGNSVAKALAERGHTVYATMRGIAGKNAEKAAALTRWAKDGGHRLHVLELDVTDDASVQAAVASAVELGGFDVVINNAGQGTWGIDEGYEIEQAQRVFNINVFGVMRVNRAVVPHLRAAGKGLIIYVSSGLGRIVFPFMAIYGATKFAIEGYAEAVSYELSHLGIQSLIIQPGAYGTTFLANSMRGKNHEATLSQYGATADLFRGFASGFEERAKSGNLGDPSEVVTAMVEEVEREAGERALRRPVGADIQQGVGAINATCDQIETYLGQAYGFR